MQALELTGSGKPLGGLRWKLNRLRCMTPAEIAHRVLRAADAYRERLGLRAWDRAAAPGGLRARVPRWIRAPSGLDPAPYAAAADRIASGRLDVFALRDCALGSPPRWNRDPKTGIEAPLGVGMLLDYRDAARVGDIKYLWEPNRHIHLVTLAQAYALTGDPKYFEVLREHLSSWWAACPAGLGPNWASALEPAMRLINWSIAWQILGGVRCPRFAEPGGADFMRAWLVSVHQHARFVRAHYSLYSSANNHLIGEATGVFVAALTWPYWEEAADWRGEALAILEREALLQNGADGVNREQASSYQQFEFDLLLIALLAGRANGALFSAQVDARLEAMLEFLAAIMDVGGNVPMIGDSDDGCVARLTPVPGFCRYASLLATGAVLFRRGDFKAKAARLDDKTRWLLGEGADAVFDALPEEPAPPRREFREGGYYILGADFETEREIRLVADCGPLGYQAIAAHGHADALAFTLSVGGLEFLVDPGTYAYHAQAQWRRYFRGTSAHNTLRVDGRDQSEQGGPFMWLAKASAGCHAFSSNGARDLLEAWHDGYQRLDDPVLHRRRLALDKRARTIAIEDRLDMRGAHDIELFFHCEEHASFERCAAGWRISRGDRSITITLPQHAGAANAVYRGSTDPILGWVSRRFDEKTPAPTLVWRARCSGDTLLTTEIRC
jgi:hypothetical protein